MARRHFRLEHHFNVQLLAEDIARRGWAFLDLGKAAKVGAQAVGRFLSGKVQTPKMASKFAKAMGFPPDRYLIDTVVVGLNKKQRQAFDVVLADAKRKAAR